MIRNDIVGAFDGVLTERRIRSLLLMRASSSLYLDTCADPGWPQPFGKSKTNWYILAELVLTPENDNRAHSETDNLLQKYIPDMERRRFPIQSWGIHYHDIIYGKNIFGTLSDIQRKYL